MYPNLGCYENVILQVLALVVEKSSIRLLNKALIRKFNDIPYFLKLGTDNNDMVLHMRASLGNNL